MTKANLINYLVDCKGNSEEEANKICSLYGTTYLSKEELDDCKKFNS